MQLRNLNIPYAQPAVFAPMAGFTDAACRHLMADHGAAWTVSEMASAKAITFGDDKSVRLLRGMGLQAVICTPPDKVADLMPIADRTLLVDKQKYRMHILPFGRKLAQE